MTVKFNQKRRNLITLISLFVTISLFYSIWDYATSKSNLLLLISFLVQVIFWFGMIYFQAAKYNDEKIVAQFGWPQIKYEDIVSIEKKFGDILIKSKKSKIGINKDIVDRVSLDNFLEYLKKRTQ
ncbi:hypothetical protein [Psychroflexus salis]|uniref:Uncharacterized protein n=1 Tax=Psychroflexus salis TaxID=1526574 RepID=A0A916ZUV4_9FLAO|nr:hypothetical protein [Psychroflexus salis]GGE15091.1 hypothetical protein GCM10010831_15520 [Psychroflexus salis]